MKFMVDNMTCNHCKMHIEKALQEAGFKEIVVDLESKIVSVEMNGKTVQDAKNAVNSIDYNFKEL